MDSATTTDLTFLNNEESARAYIHFVTPLIQQAVAAAMPPELSELNAVILAFNQTRDELQQARREIEDIKATYITAEQAKKIGVDIGTEIREPLSQSVEKHMQAMRELDEQRNRAFDEQIGATKALVLTQGQELATLKAVYEERIATHEKRLSKVESDIKNGVASVEKHTRTLNVAVGRWLEESREQKKKTDADIKALEEARETFDKQLLDTRDDMLNLRSDVDGLRGDIATKVTTTDLKVRNIEAGMAEMKHQQTQQSAEISALRLSFSEFEIQLRAAMWLVNTWGGRAVMITVLALLGISNLVN